MDDIAKLQELLQSVQKQQSAFRLAERNCIDLVVKLMERGLISLIYTLDGKEYLTLDHLKREIVQEMLAAGGRIRLGDLQDAINVDIRHIETVLPEVLAADNTIVFVDGELIAGDYFESIAEDINQELGEKGQLSMGDLARKYNMTTQLLQQRLSPLIGTAIRGQIDKGKLYTNAYIRRQSAAVRGALLACTRPTELRPLAQKLSCQAAVLGDSVRQMEETGTLPGSVSGHKESGQYIPLVHSRAVSNRVIEFFNSNGWVSHKYMQASGLGDPLSFVKNNFKSAIQLSSAVISNNLLDQVSAEAEETLHSSICLEVASLLPPELEDDAPTILQSMSIVKEGHASILEGGVALSVAWAKSLSDSIKSKAAARGAEFASLLPPSVLKNSSGGAAEFDTQMDEDEDDSGKGKKKKGKKSSKKTARAQSSGGVKAARAQSSGTSALSDSLPGVDVGSFLSSCISEAERDCLDECNVLDEVQAMFVRVAVDAIKTAASEVLRGKEQAAMEESKNAQTSAVSLLRYFQAAAKGCKLVQSDVISLEKFLVKNVGNRIVSLLTCAAAFEDGQTAGLPTDASARLKLLRSLSSSAAAEVRKCHDLVGSQASPSDLFDAILDAANALNIRFKPNDKNLEKQAVLSAVDDFEKQLASQEEPGLAFVICCQLAMYQQFQSLVHLNGKGCAGVVTCLCEAQIAGGDEAKETLASALAAVQAVLKAGGEPSPEEVQNSQTTVKNLVRLTNGKAFKPAPSADHL